MKLLLFTLLTPLLLFSVASAQSLDDFRNYRDLNDGKSLHGWYGPMQDFKRQLNPDRNYVIAILHHPANAFLFQNIYWFRNTVKAVRSQLKSNPHNQLGHFQVAWACKAPWSQERLYGITGQTGERTNQGQRMLLELDYGMSMMFANFTDGYLQSSQQSAQRIQQSASSYSFTWVAFEISEDDCLKGMAFLNKYIENESYRNFSFVNKPKNFEGGGCTSFGSELLHQFGGVSERLKEAWQIDFRIPWYFISNSNQLPENTELLAWMFEDQFLENKTDMFQLGFLPVVSRRSTDEVANIFDPELITFSLNSMIERAFKQSPEKFPQAYRVRSRKAFGLQAKAKGRIRSGRKDQFVTIDEHLHGHFKGIYNYINHKNIQLPRHRFSVINGTPGVIFEQATW